MKSPNAFSVKAVGQEKARLSQLEKVAARSNLKVMKQLNVGRDDFAILSLDVATDSVSQAVARLSQDPTVDSVQPDFIYRISATVPNDPSYSKLWGLKNTAQTILSEHASQSLYTGGNPGTSGRDMSLETAWDRTTDCSAVVVAVIDTGIKLDHEDLEDNLWPSMTSQNGYDFYNSDTDPTDDEGHGTHVAGTIGARGNNAIGTSGVCWRVQLMAIKALGADGSGSTSTIIQGVNYAVANGAQIINMSLGGGGFDSAFQSAINAAGAAGVLVVVAAGNDGRNNSTSPTYPCNFTTANLICVGAVDQQFSMASFSNYSTTHVDIGAPGTNIWSSAINGFQSSLSIPLDPADWTLTNAGFGITGGYLQTPANWNGTTNSYLANADDTAFTTSSFDMSGTNGGSAIVKLRGASQSSFDFLNFYAVASDGNPTTHPNGVLVDSISGSSGGALATLPFDLSTCAGEADCSIAFNFTSNATTQNFGFRIESVEIDRTTSSTRGLESLNGTSMAAPHVAGLAALIKANNPLFTATDIKNAILNTGTRMTPLVSRFGKGSVVNAAAAVNYVDAPTGITATVLP